MSDSDPAAGLDFSIGYDLGSAPSPGINNGTISSYGGGAVDFASPTTFDLGAIDSLVGYGVSLDVSAGASAGPIGAFIGAVNDINGQIALQGFSVDEFGRTSPNYGWSPSNPTAQGGTQ